MRNWRAPFAAIGLVLLVGCYQPGRVLTISSPPGVVEGQQARVTVSVENVLRWPIIPVSLTLYTVPEPIEYFATRKVLGEVSFLQPLQAANVRHLTSQDRVEADQVRAGDGWRRVPDTRFLHPRILLPGHSVVETFQFEAYEPYRRILYCDLCYLRLDADTVRGRLLVKQEATPPPADAARYTDVYVRFDADQLADPDPEPENYLLYRPRVPSLQDTRVITKRVPIRVKAQPFSYRAAASRARFAPRGHAYFAPGGMWVFDYHDATWFVGPGATIKLRGRYLGLVQDLQRSEARTLGLTAPRRPDDRLLGFFQKAGYSDPKATGPAARATVPVEALPQVLQHAESLGYTLDATTWRPLGQPK